MKKEMTSLFSWNEWTELRTYSCHQSYSMKDKEGKKKVKGKVVPVLN
jgi:hypothetical protein